MPFRLVHAWQTRCEDLSFGATSFFCGSFASILRPIVGMRYPEECPTVSQVSIESNGRNARGGGLRRCWRISLRKGLAQRGAA